MRFRAFLAVFWFVLCLSLRNAEESLHRSRELFECGLAFRWFGLHRLILARNQIHKHRIIEGR